jgi:hypothetical protein
MIPNGIVTGTTTVTIRVSDGSLSHTRSFTLRILGNQATFASGSNIIIADPPGLGPANPYPARITVKDILGTIRGVQVIIPQAFHRFPQDLDVALRAPTGETIMLFSDGIGNFSNPLNNHRLVFNDTSNTQVPQTGGLALSNEGPFMPTNHDDSTNDLMPNPSGGDPLNGSGFGTNLGVLNGKNPNGDWMLLVNDDQTPDGGRVSDGVFALGGWILIIGTDRRAHSRARPAGTTKSSYGSPGRM